MDIVIEALNFKMSERLKEFVEKRIEKLEKIPDMIMNAEVRLDVVKPDTAMNKEASVLLNLKGDQLFVKKTADTFEESVVLCCEVLERLMKEKKEKEKK